VADGCQNWVDFDRFRQIGEKTRKVFKPFPKSWRQMLRNYVKAIADAIFGIGTGVSGGKNNEFSLTYRDS
jgi:hypothetical protein